MIVARPECCHVRTPSPLPALKMEEGATSQGTRATSESWDGQRSRFSWRVCRKECSPVNTLVFACLTSNLWKCEVTNLCYFKLLNLW